VTFAQSYRAGMLAIAELHFHTIQNIHLLISSSTRRLQN